jgi:hypothetical protein
MDPAYQAEQPARFWADAKILRPQVLRYNVDWRGIAPRKPTVQRDPGTRATTGPTSTIWCRAPRHAPDPRGPDDPPHARWAAKKPSYRAYLFNAIPNTVYFRNFVAAAALRYSGRYDPDGDGICPEPARVALADLDEPEQYLIPVRTDRYAHPRNAPTTLGRATTLAMLNGADVTSRRRSASRA